MHGAEEDLSEGRDWMRDGGGEGDGRTMYKCKVSGDNELEVHLVPKGERWKIIERENRWR